MRPFIWPYKLGSKSAKVLAEKLECKRIKNRNSRYVPKANHFIINWGNSSSPSWWPNSRLVFNCPFSVACASNKIECLEILSDAQIEVPKFCQNKDDAKFMMEQASTESKIFCRTLTRANSGRGIIIATNPEELVDAPLYTADVGKRKEFRVHVFNGEVIDFIQKKRIPESRYEEFGITEVCMDIRSHNNGWVFCRDGIDLPDSVKNIALSAIECLNLEFGAVDCYLTSSNNTNPSVAGVFEVNTAPGLEGTTLEKYAEAIRNYCN